MNSIKLDDEIKTFIACNNKVALALIIAEIADKQLYSNYGYDNISDFCDHRYNIKKSSISQYRTVAKTYGHREKDGQYTIDEKYVEFGVEKLYRIAKIPGFSIAQFDAFTEKYGITPKTTLAQIKNIAASCKGLFSYDIPDNNKAIRQELKKYAFTIEQLKAYCENTNISNEAFRKLAKKLLNDIE